MVDARPGGLRQEYRRRRFWAPPEQVERGHADRGDAGGRFSATGPVAGPVTVALFMAGLSPWLVVQRGDRGLRACTCCLVVAMSRP